MLALKKCITALEGLQTNVKDTLAEITQMKQGIAELKQSLETSQHAQDNILSEIKTDLNSLSDNQEQAFSRVSGTIGSLKTEQDNAFNKLESYVSANFEKLDTIVGKFVKGQNTNLIIGIVSLVLIISICLLIILK